MKKSKYKIDEKELNIIFDKFEDIDRNDKQTVKSVKRGIESLGQMIIDSGLKIRLNDGWYRYQSLNNELNKWVATDGAVVESSLAKMISERYQSDFIDELCYFYSTEDIPHRLSVPEFLS